jgi:hypothetical protein
VRVRRLSFTIRTLMIAVAALGVLSAMLRNWRDLLPTFVIVLLPLVGLIVLLIRVPPQQESRRYGISAGALGLIILGIGWLWARFAIWRFQRLEGFVAIGGAGRREHYRYWGSTLPELVTGICLMFYVFFLAVACASRRRRGLLPVLMGYALGLAVAYLWLFADLEFEAFD